MTGSPLAPVIIAIVSVIALALWLAMVFYADAHPGYAERDAMAESGSASEYPASTGASETIVPKAYRAETGGRLGRAEVLPSLVRKLPRLGRCPNGRPRDIPDFL
jgi:hypothetical protein